MNRSSPIGLIVGGILLGFASLLLLPGPLPLSAMEREGIEADGTAAIQSNNLAKARDQAISQALRGAIEKVLSDAVSPHVLAGKKAVLDQNIYPSTERYVVRYRILREAELNGNYAVTISATVDADGLRGDLRRYGVMGGQAEEARSRGFRIGLVVHGAFASHHDYLAFREMISRIQGVRGVYPRLISPETSEWRLESSQGAPVIARELAKRRFKGAALRIALNGSETIHATLDSKGVLRD